MTVRAKAAFFLILMLMTAAGSFSMQVFLPALPAIQHSFGVSQSFVQLTLSLSMVSIAVSTLFYGPLADRYGRKPVLVAGMLLFLAGSLLSTFAPSVTLLIVGRVAQAAGAAAGMVLSRTIIRDVYGAEDAPKAINYLTIAMVIAPMVAPVIGGFLTEGFGWRANFAATAALALLVGALVVGLLHETLSSAERARFREGSIARSALGGLRQVARSRRFWGYTLISSFSMAIFFAFVAGAPYLMSGLLQRPPSEYGLWFLGIPGMFAGGSFAATRLLNTLGLDRSIVLGGIMGAFALAVAAGLYGLFGPAVPSGLRHRLLSGDDHPQRCRRRDQRESRRFRRGLRPGRLRPDDGQRGCGAAVGRRHGRQRLAARRHHGGVLRPGPDPVAADPQPACGQGAGRRVTGRRRLAPAPTFPRPGGRRSG